MPKRPTLEPRKNRLFVTRRRGREGPPLTQDQLRLAIEGGTIAQFDEIAEYENDKIDRNWCPAGSAELARDLDLPPFKLRARSAEVTDEAAFGRIVTSPSANNAPGISTTQGVAASTQPVQAGSKNDFARPPKARGRNRWHRLGGRLAASPILMGACITLLVAIIGVVAALAILQRSDSGMVSNLSGTKANEAARAATGLLVICLRADRSPSGQDKPPEVVINLGAAVAISPGGDMICADATVRGYLDNKGDSLGRFKSEDGRWLSWRVYVLFDKAQTFEVQSIQSVEQSLLALIKLKMPDGATLPNYFSLLESTSTVRSGDKASLVSFDQPGDWYTDLRLLDADQRDIEVLDSRDALGPQRVPPADRVPRITDSLNVEKIDKVDGTTRLHLGKEKNLEWASYGSPLLVTRSDGGLVLAGIIVPNDETSGVRSSSTYAVMPAEWKPQLQQLTYRPHVAGESESKIHWQSR